MFVNARTVETTNCNTLNLIVGPAGTFAAQGEIFCKAVTIMVPAPVPASVPWPVPVL